MIRSFEKTHPISALSPLAALNGRIPIIAVSASLIERDMQTYIDAGFDAWILKPISFDRLSKLLTAIVDPDCRQRCLYEPGQWERGGWFHQEAASARYADTRPSGTQIRMVIPDIIGKQSLSTTPTNVEPNGRHVEEEKRSLEP